MAPSNHTLISSPITRREALQRAAALLGVVFSPSLFTVVLKAQSTTDSGGSLTAEQLAIAAALAERIIPRTETPGAIDVGVPAFIDVMHGGYLDDDEKRGLEAALAYFETAARQAHQQGVAHLRGDQQDALLTAAAESASDRDHFVRIRELAVVGYFTSETVGRTVLHYDPVPGPFRGCVPLADVGNVSWTFSR